MNFFKIVLATLLALIIFSVVSFIFFIGWLGMMTAEKAVTISDNSVLHLKLQKPITEREFEDPFSEYAFGGASTTGILDLKDAIDHAREDDKIKGIFLDLNIIQTGFGQAYELRKSLADFRESGKFIYSYSDFMSEGSYYVASVADSIFLNPQGDLEFNGMSYQVTFFKGALEKLNVDAQIFRVGDYKSAVEPFMREDMSEESKQQVASFINEIHNNVIEEIAESRGISTEELALISSELKVRNPESAVQHRLADGLRYYDEVMDAIRNELDLEKDDRVRLVTLGKYRKSYNSTSSSSNRIAVIMADGDIIFGDSDQGSIGADKFTSEIRYARKSDRIKAIVLRINSPGGNFIASDELWREVYLARQEKPVIVSMSSYAASGGYYMAMPADTIVAYPNTITGSIGIFSILFDMSQFLENKLGITTDRVNTGEFSDMLTVTRPLTDYEKSIYQKQADEGYDAFVTKAAEGRGMARDEILSIASGRVWTGTQAIENGLVDVLGGFDDAVEIAAEKAGIAEDYALRFYPVQKTFWEQLLFDLGQDVKLKWISSEIGELTPYLDLLQALKEYEGVQARMPFEVTLDY